MDDIAAALAQAPHGFDIWTHTEVVPKTAPSKAVTTRWTIGPVRTKTFIPVPLIRRGTLQTPATGNEDITVQLTADQQVDLSISGEDAYDNPVEIGGDITWVSSDESIISLTTTSGNTTTAVAVGPVGTASVTVSADPDSDTGTPNFQGSMAIDVVAGDVTEVVITAGEPESKP